MSISNFGPRRSENERDPIANPFGVSNLTGWEEASRQRTDYFPSHSAHSGLDHLNGGAANYESGYVASIDFPKPGELRSRKVVSRSNARATGKYSSWKMDRMIQWESQNERNAFSLLECDPDVKSFHEQPCKIVYVIDGVKRIHYPDILVVFAKGREIWEVKPRFEALQPDIRVRTSFLAQALLPWGYTYRIALGEDLARQPRLDNANVLLRFGKKQVTDYDYEAIRKALYRRGVLSWSEACRGDYGAKGRENLCSLAVRGMLRIDMGIPISPATQFLPRKGGL
jgi:hypothetical protein